MSLTCTQPIAFIVECQKNEIPFLNGIFRAFSTIFNTFFPQFDSVRLVNMDIYLNPETSVLSTPKHKSINPY